MRFQLNFSRSVCFVRDWVRDNRGSAATEYALFLALIVGAALFGAEMLGLAVRNSFAEAGQAIVPGGHLARARSNAPENEIAEPIASQQVLVQAQLAVLAGGLLAGAGLWYALYCRNQPRRAAAEELHPPLENEVEIKKDIIFEKRQDILNILSGDMKSIFESRIQVGHVMSKRLTTVLPGAKREDIESMMRDGKLRHLLVVDSQNRLLGVISDRDLAKANGRTAAQLMTARPLRVTPDTLLNPAITALVSHRISCLPVVENEILVGVITNTDLLMTLQCTLQTLHKIAHQVHGDKHAAPAASLA